MGPGVDTRQNARHIHAPYAVGSLFERRDALISRDSGHAVNASDGATSGPRRNPVSRALTARNRLAAAVRHHPDKVEVRRRELAEAKIADYIEKVLAQRPPLTDDQRNRLAELLRPARKAAPERKAAVAARLAELDGGAA